MANMTLRAINGGVGNTVKGTPLTHAEIDQNIINLDILTTSLGATKANVANPAFTGNVTGITAAMVGLGNVNNTTDVDKPVSIAQANALALKSNIANPVFSGTATVFGTSNNLIVGGGATTIPVSITASGVDTNVSINLITKGTGVILVNGKLLGSGLTSYPYANRAVLRTLSGVGFSFIEELGIFQWVPASVEPDDDATIFAATGGVWKQVLSSTSPVGSKLYLANNFNGF